MGGTPQDAGFCDICYTDLTSLAAGPTPECRDWFQKFYLGVSFPATAGPGPGVVAHKFLTVALSVRLQGNCGFPKQTPHGASCMSGVFADRPLAYFDAGSSYFLLFVNLLSLIPLYNKKDDFGLITVRRRAISNSRTAERLDADFRVLFPRKMRAALWRLRSRSFSCSATLFLIAAG